jgi:DNA-binding beta-propeller fold protein YncE
MVKVFDAADGKVALEAPVSPPLDAGGNVAISPSGRRVAILNAGTIQVFDLPSAAHVSFEDSKPSQH